VVVVLHGVVTGGGGGVQVVLGVYTLVIDGLVYGGWIEDVLGVQVEDGVGVEEGVHTDVLSTEYVQ
jgi:hypothetical protein